MRDIQLSWRRCFCEIDIHFQSNTSHITSSALTITISSQTAGKHCQAPYILIYPTTQGHLKRLLPDHDFAIQQSVLKGYKLESYPKAHNILESSHKQSAVDKLHSLKAKCFAISSTTIFSRTTEPHLGSRELRNVAS